MTHPYPLAAVIGHPIAHSRSPIMHRHWLAVHRISGDYTALDIASDRLRNALDCLPALGFRGVNLTIPHKRVGIELADNTTEAARKIGAANTLTFTDAGIHADNTDGYGFLTNLQTRAPDWDKTQPALVLGAGGAARAVIWALQHAGVPDIRVTNRSASKARDLASEFGISAHPWEDRAQMLEEIGLLVNTTSLGMTGQPPLQLSLDALPAATTVTDIVYTPLETPLLLAAKARGCTTVDGLGMLLHQGAPGFERWFGIRPDVTDALRKAVLA